MFGSGVVIGMALSITVSRVTCITPKAHRLGTTACSAEVAGATMPVTAESLIAASAIPATVAASSASASLSLRVYKEIYSTLS